MGKYDVKVRYIFEGTYTVVAEDREEAESMVAEDCGLVLGGNIHTTRDDDEVTDWKFGCHPDLQVLSVRQRGGKSPMSVFGDRIEELRKDIIEAIRQLLHDHAMNAILIRIRAVSQLLAYCPCLLISKIKKYRQWQCLHC